MDQTQPFFHYLRQFVPLEPEEYTQLILPKVRVRRFAKREVLIRPGEVEEYFNFIIKGLVRKYFRRDKEEENTQISLEGHIIHVQESFHSRMPSEYFLEALEPSELVSISYEDLEEIYGQNAKMERLGRLVITHTMVLRDRWQMEMLKLTPRERFLQFISRNPEMLQRVPQKHLASYLNIQPETYSRFKHLLKQK
ncbi:MAG TPA: Crp/Fnr family transcriptional regulator [Chitinophagaceae bacterium]|jgi:CRP-like cAMP-binding protein|nr:Crp/Fnr family transcriptional regulator [Chitinophagaceae bacterium]